MSEATKLSDLRAAQGGGGGTTLDHVNAILAISAFAGTLDGLFLDNKTVAGTVVYPWSTLAGAPGTAGTMTGGGFGITNDTALTGVTFAALTSLAGSIKLYCNMLLTTVSTPLLASCAGRLSLYENATTSISCPLLTSCAGIIEVYDNADLIAADFSALTSIAGFLRIAGNTAIGAGIDLSALTTLNGTLIIEYNNVSALDLSALANIGSGAQLVVYQELTNAFSLDLSLIATIPSNASIGLTYCNLTTVDLSGLGAITMSLQVFSASVLLDLSAVTSISGAGTVNLECVGTGVLDLSSLATISGSGSVAITVSTVAPSLAALASITETSVVTINGGFASLNLGALAEVSSSLTITAGSLASLTLSASVATSNGFVFDCSGAVLNTATVDAALAAFAAGIGSVTSGTLNFGGGCASPTDGAGNADYLTLTGAGITVTIN